MDNFCGARNCSLPPNGAGREDISQLERSNDPLWIALQQHLRPEHEQRRPSNLQHTLFGGQRPQVSYHSAYGRQQLAQTAFPNLLPVDNTYLDILASHLDPHGHAPLLFGPESNASLQQPSSSYLGLEGSRVQAQLGTLTHTDSNETIPDQLGQQITPRPAKTKQAGRQKATPPVDEQPREPQERPSPKKRKPRAQAKVLRAEDLKVEQEEHTDPPKIKPVARKRAKQTAESEPGEVESEGEVPEPKKRKSRSGAKASGGMDNLRAMRRPRRSAREKRSVGAPVLAKVLKKPLSEAASKAAAAKAELERQQRRNAWWCITDPKPSSQPDKGVDWSWQPKAPASFMRRPKIQGFNDPLLPPATDSEDDEDQGDGGWTGKSRANDAELKEKTLFNYTLSHFQLRQIMARHLADEEMIDCEKSMLLVLEANMEIILQLDYRDLWYLEETYVRQASIHGKFIEGMLLPGVVLNRVGMIMYASESFCNMVQRTPQEVNMRNIIEYMAPDSIYNFVKIGTSKLQSPGLPYNAVFDCGFLRQDSQETIRARMSMRVMLDIYGLTGVMPCIIMPFTHQQDPATNMDAIVNGVTFM